MTSREKFALLSTYNSGARGGVRALELLWSTELFISPGHLEMRGWSKRKLSGLLNDQTLQLFSRADHFDDLDNNRPPFLALAQKSAAAAVCLTVWPHTVSAARRRHRKASTRNISEKTEWSRRAAILISHTIARSNARSLSPPTTDRSILGSFFNHAPSRDRRRPSLRTLFLPSFS